MKRNKILEGKGQGHMPLEAAWCHQHLATGVPRASHVSTSCSLVGPPPPHKAFGPSL